MKCLSIRQPFADFVADGLKTAESRVWETSYRGPLLICASLKIHEGTFLEHDPDAGRIKTRNCLEFVKEKRLAFPEDGVFLLGHAIAVADLVDCRPMNTRAWGDERLAMCRHYPGAFVWILENARRITPFPIVGKLRLWDYTGPQIEFV